MAHRNTYNNSGTKTLKIIFYAIIVFVLTIIYGITLSENRMKSDDGVFKNSLQYLLEESSSQKVLQKNQSKETTTEKDEIINKELFYSNNNWMFNINIMQFSSYIIIKEANNRNIEGMVYVNGDPNEQQLACLLYSSTGLQKPIILKVKNMYKAAVPYVRKIVCEFEETSDFNLKEIVSAIIFENDFDMNENDASKYPRGIINYQIPDIITVQEPRIKDVGVCLQFVSRVYPGIYNWVKLHKDFKAAELVMYDGSSDRSLKYILKSNFTDFCETREYKIRENEICDVNTIRSYKEKFPNYFQQYRDKCSECFHNTISLNDGNHNHLTANDCYIKLNYKYEFVTLYDLDEVSVLIILLTNHN